MSEKSSSANDSSPEQGMVSKIVSFVTSKKGMYIIAAVTLICVAYYYFKSTKNSAKELELNEENTEIPQAPPGYVTVPVEMLQGIQQQQGSTYDNIPQNNNINYQTQQHLLQQQNNENNTQAQQNILQHNIEEDEEEAEAIAQQDLTKEEMESIQAQLNAMQQQRQSA